MNGTDPPLRMRRCAFPDAHAPAKRKVTTSMSQATVGQKRIRRYYGNIREVLAMPNLIEVQKSSYDLFLNSGDGPKHIDGEGLQGVFQSVFPIKDFNENAILEFVKYELEKPKYDVEECQARDMTYSAPLKVTLRLIVFDIDETTGAKSVKDIKEQGVYMGDMPLMTPNGTFIVNGTERVIVSQMHRSPGVFFDHDKGKTHSSGKLLFACRIIPYRGSWLDFEFDAKDIVFARIDRRRKLPVTTLLYALGLHQEGIMDAYYKTVDFKLVKNKGWVTKFFPERVRGTRPTYDLVDAATGEVICKAGDKVTPRMVKKWQEDGKITELLVPYDHILGRFVAKDIINEDSGAIYVEAGDEITQTVDRDGEVNGGTLKVLLDNGVTTIPVLDIDNVNVGPYIRNTMAADKNMGRDGALMDIYRVMRPGEPPTVEAASALFDTLFFDKERYDLSAVGRVKMNMRLDLGRPDTQRTLDRDDIIACIKALVELRDGKGEIDDIDHLGNRRVRSVGELMENQYRVGLLRMERAIKERMSSVEIDTVMPQDLINAKPAAAAVREFFGSSQLSQFMDQTNPLSEVTHKRRLSALGPGGLTRERAGFEVRDVHPTHYGRMCPIETPEGPNIGLINSLATFARVNKYGFIETPYRKVIEGKVTDDVQYMSATEEMRHTVAQANANLDAEGRFADDLISTRQAGEFMLNPPDAIDLIDVSPKQLVSVAASLIPFLENDDANRALMGSNMQRQAVPLLQADAPFVGTGIESVVAEDSGAAIMARRGGIIDQVDATRIVVRATEDLEIGDAGVDIYRLKKYTRSNQNTCINQKPIVSKGDKVDAGEIVADGPATDGGELALGRNALVAFLPWEGYNFEDAILISEELVKEDAFTSIHIQVFELEARDTKLGPEEITRDIPNVSEDALRNLDESGIVRLGAKVKHGDILVGKVTPKGETELAPEEKLLRAIFGEKAEDVRDASLTVPPGAEGVVVDVRVCSRREKTDTGSRGAVSAQVAKVKREYQERINEIRETFVKLLKDEMLGLKILEDVVDHKTDELVLEKGKKLKVSHLEKADYGVLARLRVDDKKLQQKVTRLVNMAAMEEAKLIAFRDSQIEMLRKGDELPPGVIKLVKVFVATKRRLSVGDKMAGRHGNKGVIAKILPVEDMPYLPDGTPVQLVLNPLGVPSRMNVGQVLETTLGWAARVLGMKVATPVFNGASEGLIADYMKKAGLPEDGKIELRDGRTGKPFDQLVTVGYLYMMKLNHLVDDKIHARAIGPYSLVTQQPLGGKAQFGGQRFGEMEVWALQAYGAAYTLQELLTIKSDDIQGRTKAYEAVVKGDRDVDPGTPESFNVLVREMQSLCLDVIKLARVEDGTDADEDEEELEG